MKKNTIWVVRALTAIEPGKLVWMDFKLSRVQESQTVGFAITAERMATALRIST